MSSEEPHAHAHAQCQHHEAHHHHEHAHGHEGHGHGHGHEHAHGHHGHHGHGHEHGTAAEANKDYFDEHAHEQAESAELRGLAEQAARAMAQQARLDKESTALLDFACGTGLLSRALAPLVKSVVGVDISPRSVELYNKAAAEAGYAPERMRAVALELKGEPGELGGALFDAAVCSMSFHHFDAPEHMAALLAARLKPGAPLLVVDFAEREDGAPAVVLNDVNPTLAAAVPHIRGFSEARLRSMFAAAGLTDFALADAGPFSWRGASAKLFVARGVKP